MKSLRLLAIFAGLLCGGETAKAASPAEIYGSLPNISMAKLSPDGTHFAAMQSFEGRDALVIYNIYGTPGKNAKVIAMDSDKGMGERLDGFFWANDQRLIVTYRYSGIRFGVDTIETRMVSVARDEKDIRPVPKPKRRTAAKSGQTSGIGQIQSNIISKLPNDPDHILVALDREGYGQRLNAYRMDVKTGSLKKVTSGNASVVSYMADNSGALRLRYRYFHASDSVKVEIYSPSKNQWLPGSDLYAEIDRLPIVGFSNDPSVVYVKTSGPRGLVQLRGFNLDTGVLGPVEFSHPSVDFGELVRADFSGNVVGLGYTEHFRQVRYFDQDYLNVFNRLSAQLPGRVLRIVSQDKAGEKWILLVDGPNTVPSFHLYVRATGQFVQIGNIYPKISDDRVFDVEAVSYKARDGLTIPAYVTKPKGVGPFPAVVLPHGGPDSRDTQSFDFIPQFLASLGYVVLQPNFRGSEGYGEEFRKAGFHEWGLKMQDDVTDGTHWLVSQGYAVPNRICIMGASYGGYAALMGVVREPELYQCAISIAPVTDVSKFLREKSVYKFQSRNDPRIGNGWDDRGRIRDTSPANNIDRITAGVLLMHGENDRSVSVEHSQIMARRLKSAGKTYRYVELPDGDHYLSLEANRVRALKEAEEFLAAYIGR